MVLHWLFLADAVVYHFFVSPLAFWVTFRWKCLLPCTKTTNISKGKKRLFKCSSPIFLNVVALEFLDCTLEVVFEQCTCQPDRSEAFSIFNVP